MDYSDRNTFVHHISYMLEQYEDKFYNLGEFRILHIVEQIQIPE